MKCIILAAGYATRLYPLTKNKAKGLLPIGGKPMVEHLLEKVEKVDEIDQVFIVTNERFHRSFLQWASKYESNKEIVIINDQTTTNENRLGAVADIQYVLEATGIQDDLMVLAGDNLFQFELTDFVDFFRRRNHDCITTHEMKELDRLKSSGVIELAEDNRVVSSEEKPDQPKSHWAVPPFYLYKKETLPLFRQYLAAGNNPDAPGNFIPWLLQQKPVYAFKFQGLRYDIGTLESYEKVQNLFS